MHAPGTFMLDAGDSPSGAAALALVGALIGMLFKSGRLTPEEANGVAALAAVACGASGYANAATLIESMFPDSKGFDLSAFDADNGIEIEKVTKQ